MSDKKEFDFVKVSQTLREAEQLSSFDNFGILLKLIDTFNKDKVHFEYLVHSIICIKIQEKRKKMGLPFEFSDRALVDNQTIVYKIISSYCEIFSYQNVFSGTPNNSVIKKVYDYDLWISFKQMIEFLCDKELLNTSSHLNSLFHELMVSSYKYKDCLEKCIFLSNELNPFYYFLEEKKIIPITFQFTFYNLDIPYILLLDKLLENCEDKNKIDILNILILQKSVFAPILFDRLLSQQILSNEHLDILLNNILFKINPKHFYSLTDNVSYYSQMTMLLDKYNLSHRIKFKSLELESNQFIVPFGFLTTINFMPKEPVIHLLMSRLDDKVNLIICFNPKTMFNSSGVNNVYQISVVYDENFFIELLPKLSIFLKSYPQDLTNPDLYSQFFLEKVIQDIGDEIKRQYLVYSL